MEKSRLNASKMIKLAREWKETLEASRPRLLALDNISWKKETRQATCFENIFLQTNYAVYKYKYTTIL